MKDVLLVICYTEHLRQQCGFENDSENLSNLSKVFCRGKFTRFFDEETNIQKSKVKINQSFDIRSVYIEVYFVNESQPIKYYLIYNQV